MSATTLLNPRMHVKGGRGMANRSHRGVLWHFLMVRGEGNGRSKWLEVHLRLWKGWGSTGEGFLRGEGYFLDVLVGLCMSSYVLMVNLKFLSFLSISGPSRV